MMARVKSSWVTLHVIGWVLLVAVSAYLLTDRSNPEGSLSVKAETWFVPVVLAMVFAVALYLHARDPHENLARAMSRALLTWGVLVLAVAFILFLLQSIELTAIQTSGDPSEVAGGGQLQETMYRDGVDTIPLVKVPQLFGWDDPVVRDGSAATVLVLGFASLLVKVGLIVGLLMSFSGRLKSWLLPNSDT